MQWRLFFNIIKKTPSCVKCILFCIDIDTDKEKFLSDIHKRAV